MEDDMYSISKMKDFLMVYNKMAETCFSHCIDNFNCRQLTGSEEKCLENCASKSLAVNHKVMVTYIDLQPEIMRRRAEDMQKQQDLLNALNASKSNS